MYQCYYLSDYQDKKTRCKNEQEDCWCSEEHKKLWKEKNYVDFRPKGEHTLSIPEIKKRLKEMQLKKREERFKEQQRLV